MIRVIGIDCATEPSKVGLALGGYCGGKGYVKRVQIGSESQTPVDVLVKWIKANSGPVLLAIDAPLGWPESLGIALKSHEAGNAFNVDANSLFRRTTDRYIRENLKKQSLDVGADRIARTAFAAVDLLNGLRKRLRSPIPLAWDPKVSGISVIEVYPAATLKALAVDARGYKSEADNGERARKRVLQAMSAHIDVKTKVPDISKKSDGLDAAICVLAGCDFLSGSGLTPEPKFPVQKEGWIWVRKPNS